MKTYKVPVVWQMHGYVKVKAENMAEAVDEVEDGGGDMPLPMDGSYIEGSFEVDHNGLVDEDK